MCHGHFVYTQRSRSVEKIYWETREKNDWRIIDTVFIAFLSREKVSSG